MRKNRIALLCVLTAALPQVAYAATNTQEIQAYAYLGLLGFLALIGICWGIAALLTKGVNSASTHAKAAKIKSNGGGLIISTLQWGNMDVTKGWQSTPNYLNGWTLRIKGFNATGKTLKYIVFHFSLLNRVNDPASLEHGEPRVDAKVTGPIESGVSNDEWFWENLFWSGDFHHARLESITVTYMDDTEDELSGARIDAVDLDRTVIAKSAET